VDRVKKLNTALKNRETLATKKQARRQALRKLLEAETSFKRN